MLMKAMLLGLLTLGMSFGQMMNQGRIRVVHASPDAPAVDILVDGNKVIEALPFREYTEYLGLPAGSHEIRVNVTGTTTTVLQATPTIAAGQDYTAIAIGFAGGRQPAIQILLLNDNNELAPNGGVKLRVVHGAPSAPAVDVYLTTPFEAIGSRNPGLTNVPFGAASGYLAVPPSLYQARVTPAGTKTVAIDSHRLVTWSGIVRTVIAIDNAGGGAPFGFLVLPDRN
jgi:hypothetical protein